MERQSAHKMKNKETSPLHTSVTFETFALAKIIHF